MEEKTLMDVVSRLDIIKAIMYAHTIKYLIVVSIQLKLHTNYDEV